MEEIGGLRVERSQDMRAGFGPQLPQSCSSLKMHTMAQRLHMKDSIFRWWMRTRSGEKGSDIAGLG